ncbi:Major Facilitator Superfamily protein [Brevibacterium siliguriense]|uniref:Major Facilitator Superfamily protein n=1 Tax=Brevibacterium siliguriense TaxID=1136497 RepID=A0A1H1XBP3_9MICO|nr:MFS transporter [Brevibacterium siliguriense]SDT06724.1 Major Facilitator Superfamily protein [Brevibacterium siliguriense]
MRDSHTQTSSTSAEAAPGHAPNVDPAPTAGRPAPVLWPLHLGAFLATFMFSVSNVAIPAVKADIGASDATSALIVGLFSAAFASGLILFGRIGDRFGRRRLFMIGTGALVITSIAVGLAPDPLFLLVARATQGLAAAVMMPQILASFQHSLSGAARLKAISLFGAFSGVGTVGGQVLGGGLISLFGETWGWRAAFLSCAVAAAAAYLGSLRLTESHSIDPAPLDAPGAILLGVGMICLVTGLALGPVTGWLPIPAILLAVSVLGFATFVVWQSRADATGRFPLIPPAVVAVPAAWVGMLMALVFFAGFGTFLFNFSLVSQTGHSDPAYVSGLTLALFCIAFLISSLMVHRLVASFTGPGTMLLGTGLQVAGLLGIAWVSSSAGTGWQLWFQVPALVLGAGQAMQFGPLVGTVVGAVPDRVAGLSGGLIATMQQSGIAVGVALLGALFHSLTAVFGFDIAFAFACLVQILLSIAFGAGAWYLLRVSGRATRTSGQSA